MDWSGILGIQEVLLDKMKTQVNPSWTGLPELCQGLRGGADLPYHYKIPKLGGKPFFSKFANVCITSK